MRPLAVIGNVNVDLILGPTAPWPRAGTEIIVDHDDLRVGGQAVIIMRERSGRFARAALVIDKRADTFCRKLALQCEVSERGAVFRAVHEYHDGHASRSWWQDEPSGQCRAGVLKL